ncbi:MAG TPA: response regulator transcription factor [Ottowia sp.]|uniref:response regulator transcription factor n=1 Tax=Ottowia sp. TaxID=1898956 RepID=UPI002BF731F7|nr:response regulator transcription factor [Ottowia sp.]HMN21654.1 response regulator transcription factor [Ottowia sp.]
MAIYVIEDHPLMRDAIAMLLRRIRPGAEIAELGQLSELDAAIALHGAPKLFCLDLKLPDAGGLTGVRRLATQYPDVPLMVISATPASEAEEWCREAGADVYVEKSVDAAVISDALRRILDVDDDDEPLEQPKLSKRQKQLLVMLDQGLSNREIAERLEISEHTVKVHLWRLFRRLGVKSRTQALHYARKHGLLMNP